MNLNPLPWIRGCLVRSELTQWTAAGIIQPDQHRRIDEQYDQDCCGITVPDCARLTLFALSALAMMLALVLVVADHWREIYLALKIAVALVGMSLAHGFGYWYRFHQGQERRGNIWFLVGTALYGCVMLLVVDEYDATLYRTVSLGWVILAWAAGTVPLAWVLGSRSLLVMASVIGTAWVILHIMATGSAKVTSLFVVQQLFLLQWSYTNRSRGLFVVTVLGLVAWWSMLAVAEGWGREGLFWIATVGPLLVLTGLRHDETHPFANIYQYVGIGWSLLVLLALALPSVSRGLIESGQTMWTFLVFVAVMGSVLALVPAPRRLDYSRDWPAITALWAVTFLPAIMLLIGQGLGLKMLAAGALTAVFNAAALAVVVGLILGGAATSCSGYLAAGLAYFVLWVTFLTIDSAGALTVAASICAVAAAVLLVLARLQTQKRVPIHETVSVENV